MLQHVSRPTSPVAFWHSASTPQPATGTTWVESSCIKWTELQAADRVIVRQVIDQSHIACHAGLHWKLLLHQEERTCCCVHASGSARVASWEDTVNQRPANDAFFISSTD
jgi:hypothetical protein